MGSVCKHKTAVSLWQESSFVQGSFQRLKGLCLRATDSPELQTPDEWTRQRQRGRSGPTEDCGLFVFVLAL